MGKNIFGIVIAAFFVIMGFFLATNESANNPDGTLSWINYIGIAGIVFFGLVAIIGIRNYIMKSRRNN
ncbi:MAG: hypothetical protein EOO45_16435 [Flavobacterium sp.]|nr:MAG: hypothetical protein EOO45_16435 [Flavobacterium sp.]